MVELRINYSETIRVGNQVSQKGSDFQELLNTINSINSELQSYWEGQDASKYSTAVATQAQQVQKLVDTINEIGTYLVRVGDVYE